jgi:hypothetical protein
METSSNLSATVSELSLLLSGAADNEDTASSASAISASAEDVSSIMRNPWDPFHCADWDMQQPSATCLARIKRYAHF